MPILPSLLEYSVESLEKRVVSILENKEKFLDLQHSEDGTVNLHLDFVLTQFARDRSVMSSIAPLSLLSILNRYFFNHKLNLSIHLMGAVEDLFQMNEFFQTLSYNPHWNYLIFLPEPFFVPWKLSDFVVQNPNLKVGIWLDIDEWSLESEFSEAEHYLLMTVKAGKSGQKLAIQEQNDVWQIVKQNSDKNFIADGGWSIDSKNLRQNLDIVSYSSFWQEFSNS